MAGRGLDLGPVSTEEAIQQHTGQDNDALREQHERRLAEIQSALLGVTDEAGAQNLLQEADGLTAANNGTINTTRSQASSMAVAQRALAELAAQRQSQQMAASGASPEATQGHAQSGRSNSGLFAMVDLGSGGEALGGFSPVISGDQSVLAAAQNRAAELEAARGGMTPGGRRPGDMDS